MGKIISVTLPQNLPENWDDSKYVSPNGTEVGLNEKYGYNYLMKQVNATQKAVEEIDKEALASGKCFDTKTTKGRIISSVGWYRVAKIYGSTSGNSSALLFLGHNYNNGGASSLIAAINFHAYAPSVTVLDHKSANPPIFDKIRIVSKPSEQESYLDVHYNRAVGNAIVAGALFFDYEGVVENEVQPLVEVDESPEGETVILTQVIPVTKSGSVITSGGGDITGQLGIVETGSTTKTIVTQYDREAILRALDTTTGNFKQISVGLRDLKYGEQVDGIYSGYDILHMGNFTQLMGVSPASIE